jgi:hypothetical protein
VRGKSLARMAELGRLSRAALALELIRTGLAAGLFEALAEPSGADELAESRGLAPDLCSAWLRAAHASGLVEYRAGRYRSGAADHSPSCWSTTPAMSTRSPLVSASGSTRHGAPC